MKRGFLSLITSTLLVLALGTCAEAFAQTHAHPSCGIVSCTDRAHHADDHVQAEYIPYTTGMTLSDGMNIYLTEDTTVTSTIIVPSGAAVRLCLNGHTLSKMDYGNTISVAGSLILCDCSKNIGGQITHATTGNDTYQGSGIDLTGSMRMYSGSIRGNKNAYENGGGIYMYASSSLTMYGGSIENNGNTYGEGGGVYMSGGSLTLRGGSIRQNLASRGGGVYMSSGSLTLYSGSIENNKADSYGGGVHMDNADLTIYDGLIGGNEAKERGGGGVYMTDSTYTMYAGEIANNSSAWDGGGINAYGSTITIHNGKIRDNKGQAGGGLSVNGSLIIYDGEITGNTASRGGGGISSYETLTMTGGVIQENTSQWEGGGIEINGSASMSGVKIRCNSTPDYGGGVYVSSTGNAELTDCEIDSNTSYRGGGIYTVNNAVIKTSRTRVTNNTAPSGGGVFLDGGNMTMSSSVVSSNLATAYYGGGIYTENTCVLTINDGEISENRSARDGGGIYVFNGTVKINGGKVTANRTIGRGGGIFANSLTLKGSVQVKDNASNSAHDNLHLNSGMITLEGALTGGAGSIGICMDNIPWSDDSPVNYMVPATGYVLRQEDLAAVFSEDGFDSRIGSDGIAEFCLPKAYGVTVSVCPADSGTVKIQSAYDNSTFDNPAQISPNTYLKLAASPKEGGSFVGWYQAEYLRSSSETCYESVRKNTEYTAIFRPTKTLTLPLALTKIEDESFINSAIQAVEIAHGCASIGAHAFADCAALAWIRIPSSVTEIANDAFDGCGDLIIIAPENSAAQAYAFEHGLRWVQLR